MRAIKTLAITAFAFATSLLSPKEALSQTGIGNPTKSAATAKMGGLISEHYTLQSVAIELNGRNDVRFTFVGNSDIDPATAQEESRKYSSGSGKFTKMKMVIGDNGQGYFSADVPEIRVNLTTFKITDPGVGQSATIQRADIEGYIISQKSRGSRIAAATTVYGGSPVMPDPYDVDTIYIKGARVPLFSNKLNLAQDLASQKYIKDALQGNRSMLAVYDPRLNNNLIENPVRDPRGTSNSGTRNPLDPRNNRNNPSNQGYPRNNYPRNNSNNWYNNKATLSGVEDKPYTNRVILIDDTDPKSAVEEIINAPGLNIKPRY